MTPDLLIMIALLFVSIVLSTGAPFSLTLASVLIAVGYVDVLMGPPASVPLIVGAVLLQVMCTFSIASWFTSTRNISRREPQ